MRLKYAHKISYNLYFEQKFSKITVNLIGAVGRIS